MPFPTLRHFAGAVAVPAFALVLVACSSDSGDVPAGDVPAELSPEQAVLASYEGLEGESYQLRSEMTINGVDFMEMVQEVEGEAMQVSQDMFMSAMLDVMGDEVPQDDPEMAAMMEAMFSDMHTETIVVDDTFYLRLSGGMFESMAEQYGEDAWFTADLAELSDTGGLAGVYEEFGGFDLASQTEALLTELTDVQETGDGVYTGTLTGDSEVMQQMMGATAGEPELQEIVEVAEVSITLDGGGLLERMEISFPEIEGMAMTMISEVVEIGGDYGIAAPDSDNVHSFEEFANAMQ